MANEAWQISSPSVLTLNTLSSPIPKPGPNQALIRVHAVSLNYREILILDHNPSYPGNHKKDLIPSADGAGVIEEVGEGSSWKKGDRVVLFPNNWLDGSVRNFDFLTLFGCGAVDGTLRRWVVLDDAYIVKAPDNLSLVEASTLFTAGLTSFRALFDGLVKIEAGTTVLTQGTGGVSAFGIQLASAAGATVIATSSSDDKLVIAKRLGATHVINYRTTPNWADEVLRLTDGKGVDHVLDVGGSGTIEQSLQATRFDGVVTLLGILTQPKLTDLIPAILYGNKTVRGVLAASSKKQLVEMVSFLEKHDIHPAVARVFEFEEGKEAFEYMRHLRDVGKVVVKV